MLSVQAKLYAIQNLGAFRTYLDVYYIQCYSTTLVLFRDHHNIQLNPKLNIEIILLLTAPRFRGSYNFIQQFISQTTKRFELYLIKIKLNLLGNKLYALIPIVGKQSVCSDANCCDFRRGRPHNRIDWGSAVDTNHRIY